VNVSISSEVIVDESVRFCITLSQCLGPVARLASQVRTSILGKALDVNRVVGGESEPEDSRPTDGELSESETDTLAHLHWSIAEDNPLTKAVPALGLTAIPKDLTVVAMPRRELKWRLIGVVRTVVAPSPKGIESGTRSALSLAHPFTP